VTYLLPIWGLFWGWLAHETIGWTAFAGVAVVVCGLVLLNWRRGVIPVATATKVQEMIR